MEGGWEARGDLSEGSEGGCRQKAGGKGKGGVGDGEDLE